MIDWRVSSVQNCVAEYLRKESRKSDVEVSDDNDDAVDGRNALVEVDEINTYEALAMLDKLVNLDNLNYH